MGDKQWPHGFFKATLVASTLAAMAATKRISWTVKRFKHDIRLNDQVFLWRSKGDGSHGTPGIIAECFVDSDVSVCPADPIATRFSHTPRTPNVQTDRVWLRDIFIVAESEVLGEEEIARHELLQKVGPLGFRSAANYKVSDAQRIALNSLWSERVRRSAP